MEKRCEFCKALRPVVFCKSDAAHLCLSCDAKVHSANALSYRHFRTLVCESCRFQPALVRCFDHQMFMCQSCDSTHHVSLDHHKKIVSCYVGCPSAKDLAELWGLDLKHQSIAFSHPAAAAAAAANSSSLVSALYAESGGSSSRGTKKVVNDENQQKSISYLILQQIMELERLQLSEGVEDSCLAHVKERAWKDHRMLENDLEHSDDPLLDKTEEPLSSPFPQLEAGNPLNGEPFWQYRSPVQNNEIWLQNMQDLGVCDEVKCFDEVNIPDVDVTFRNFEELFGGEQEAADDDNNEKKHPSLGKFELDRGYATATVEQKHDGTQTLSIRPCPSQSVSSSSSFSVSRITGDSDYKDEELTPTFPKQQVSCGRERDQRYKEKRVARQGQYTSPGSKCDFKKRGKSQVLKVEGLEADSGTF